MYFFFKVIRYFKMLLADTWVSMTLFHMLAVSIFLSWSSWIQVKEKVDTFVFTCRSQTELLFYAFEEWITPICLPSHSFSWFFMQLFKKRAFWSCLRIWIYRYLCLSTSVFPYVLVNSLALRILGWHLTWQIQENH